jgi:hypothetical protein
MSEGTDMFRLGAIVTGRNRKPPDNLTFTKKKVGCIDF